MTWEVMVLMTWGGYSQVAVQPVTPELTMRLAVLIAVFLGFTGWSVTVAMADGPLGFLTLAMRERWALQVLLDLAISLVVGWTWLRVDARERGIPAWPYMLGTLTLGSIGVLAYLIHRELRGKAADHAPAHA